jgi:predicted ATPase with chaperone activity
MVQTVELRGPLNGAERVDSLEAIWPEAPNTVEETGLSSLFLEELALKTVHYAGPSTLEHIARRMGLSVSIIEDICDSLRSAGLVEAAGVSEHSGQQYSTLGYKFALTGRGEQRAADALTRSRYAGLAPVVLDQYIGLAVRQSLRSAPASPEQISAAMASFVLQPHVRESLAHAFHSGRPALIYGETGNGKTAIADAYARSFVENVLIPGALYVPGHTIRIFDAAVHRRVDPATDRDVPASTDEEIDGSPEPGILRRVKRAVDHRWLPVRRPVVVVGGELNADGLELAYDETGGFYIAPPHLKAQDGIFIIDDFGRQQVRPEELLNRWIVPLERGYDLLTLKSGESLSVPFETSVLFATNLSPADLADEAFLRRIPYKVRLTNPGEPEMAEITRRECRGRQIECDEAGVEAIVAAIFRPGRPAPKAVYPRDLISIIEDGARYNGRPLVLTPETVADACDVYFLDGAS